ncbi:MAG: rhomboid family intramembrane serine protease [Bryobacteraceae bacterium]
MIPLRDSQPSNAVPLVTILLIVVNVAIFLFEFTLDGFSRNEFVMEYAMVPGRLHWGSMITSMFLHGGFMHLIGNMWFLWIFGDNIEDLLGRYRFLVFYLACGVAAGVTHLMFNAGSLVPTVGASGAIAGVMGAYMVRFPHSRIVTLIPLIIFMTTAELPAWVMLVYWFVIQIFSGVGELAATHNQAGGVAWFAHVGGFLAGIVLVQLMAKNERYRLRPEMRW